MIEQPITHPDPDVSVVIPTIPASDHEAVVEALRAQTADAFEVLVVNDDALDICEARNAGIDAAEADIVALTDDDTEPPADWVETIIDTFEERPELVCIEGPVVGGLSYDGTRRYVGCNVAFRREAALEVGGYDSEYAGWRDDTEFGWRMEKHGPCAYVESLVMNHPPRPRSTIDRELEAKLQAEYPERYEEVLVPDTLLGRLNDWLWRHGVWDAVDRIRHRGEAA